MTQTKQPPVFPGRFTLKQFNTTVSLTETRMSMHILRLIMFIVGLASAWTLDVARAQEEARPAASSTNAPAEVALSSELTKPGIPLS